MPVKSQPKPSVRRGDKTKSSDAEDRGMRVLQQGNMVYVEKGVTKSLGDFQFARVTVGIALPLDPTPEMLKKVEATIKIANEVIDDELSKQIDEILKEQ